MSNDTALQVYPRGFIGKVINKEGSKANIRSLSPNLMFGFDLVVDDKDKIGSVNVDELVKSYHASTRYRRGFNFFRETLKIALQTFNLTDFGKWLLVQRESGKYSSLHERFLLDTCEFILTGKRSINTETWLNMFVREMDFGNTLAKDNAYKTPDKEYLDLYKTDSFKTSAVFKKFQGRAIEDVVLDWMGQGNGNGLDDLLVSLEILFGSLMIRNYPNK